VKEKWLKALRSGDYQQGRGALRKDEAFCCLGVLCDFYGRETGEEWQEGHCDEDDDCRDWEIAGGTALLPSDVVIWAGLGDENPIVKDHSLADWNDSKGASFPVIADLIEESL
jgi:hypothetical protein